jgi:FkbM family methyltransferase
MRMTFQIEPEDIREIKVEPLDVTFKVYSEPTLYDNTFWDKVESGSYEPDTLFTLKRHVSPYVVFFDVGSAVGVMTLVAASLGAKCITYEPVPKFFTALSKNIDLNLGIKDHIVSKQSVVSNISQSTISLRDQVGHSISSIVYSENQDEVSNLVDLKKEILNYCSTLKPIIKFDIEGAEYKLLWDEELLQILQEKKAILVLAIHPGFFRPMRKHKNLFILKLAWFKFIIRNYIDNYKLYKNLISFCKVKRSNDVEVLSAHKFCMMSAAGVYEYNLYF